MQEAVIYRPLWEEDGIFLGVLRDSNSLEFDHVQRLPEFLAGDEARHQVGDLVGAHIFGSLDAIGRVAQPEVAEIAQLYDVAPAQLAGDGGQQGLQHGHGIGGRNRGDGIDRLRQVTQRHPAGGLDGRIILLGRFRIGRVAPFDSTELDGHTYTPMGLDFVTGASAQYHGFPRKAGALYKKNAVIRDFYRKCKRNVRRLKGKISASHQPGGRAPFSRENPLDWIDPVRAGATHSGKRVRRTSREGGFRLAGGNPLEGIDPVRAGATHAIWIKGFQNPYRVSGNSI